MFYDKYTPEINYINLWNKNCTPWTNYMNYGTKKYTVGTSYTNLWNKTNVHIEQTIYTHRTNETKIYTS